MSEMHIEADEALDRYIQYIEFDGDDDAENEELRWQFIDYVVPMLEKMTGRKVSDEIVY